MVIKVGIGRYSRSAGVPWYFKKIPHSKWRTWYFIRFNTRITRRKGRRLTFWWCFVSLRRCLEALPPFFLFFWNRQEKILLSLLVWVEFPFGFLERFGSQVQNDMIFIFHFSASLFTYGTSAKFMNLSKTSSSRKKKFFDMSLLVRKWLWK